MGDNNTTRPERRWVSPVKEPGCSSPRIREESQKSAEIAVERKVSATMNRGQRGGRNLRSAKDLRERQRAAFPRAEGHGVNVLVYCQNRVAAMPRTRTAETPNSAWSTSLLPTRRCSRWGSSAQKIAISPPETTRNDHASVVIGVPVIKSTTQAAQSARVAILANPSRDIQQSVAYKALPSDSFAHRAMISVYSSRSPASHVTPKNWHGEQVVASRSSTVKCSSIYGSSTIQRSARRDANSCQSSARLVPRY
jgi:hypothetical protein